MSCRETCKNPCKLWPNLARSSATGKPPACARCGKNVPLFTDVCGPCYLEESAEAVNAAPSWTKNKKE